MVKAISYRMKTFSAIILLFVSHSAFSQYYYNDIVGTAETNRQMKLFRDNKVLTVTSKGTDSYGKPAADFSELQEVKENGMALKISTYANRNKSIYYNRFDNQGRLISITDSSTDIQSITTYKYDAAGRIIEVRNSSKDSANENDETEIHTWYYNKDGKAEKMWRVINGTDSLEVRLIPDENGNPGTEKSYRKGVETGTSLYYYDSQNNLKVAETGLIYYYYDDKNRLTDIVRYNMKARRLMPDIMFEYDDNDRVIQRITPTSNLLVGYLVWRYAFNEKGLKSKEALYNRNRKDSDRPEYELTGKIEYIYTFGQ